MEMTLIEFLKILIVTGYFSKPDVINFLFWTFGTAFENPVLLNLDIRFLQLLGLILK